MKEYLDVFIVAVYVLCHIVQSTHEVAWVCAAASILFLQHINKLSPQYAALMGKVISCTQKTVTLPNMYVYPMDAVYVAIAIYTMANTLHRKCHIFQKQLSHRKMMMCVFIVLSYVAHGRHSNILKQPLWQSCARVLLYVAASRASRSTDWDTLGKTLWILNVPLAVLILVPIQLKIETDYRVTDSKREIVITEKGPMLV